MRGLYVMKPSLGHTLGKIAFLFGFRDRLPDNIGLKLAPEEFFYF